MNETPNEPVGPDEDRRGQHNDPASSDPQGTQSLPPGEDEDDEEDLDAYPATSRRRILSGRRLAATGLVIVGLLGGGMALALNGGDGADDNTTSSSDSNGSSQEDALFEFSQCMRDNGIEEFPDPSADGGIDIGGTELEDQVNTEEFQAAQEECESILDEAAAESGERLTPEELAEQRDRIVALAQCVRDRGYEDFPTPEVDDYGRVKGLGAPDIDPSVVEECMQETDTGQSQGDDGGSGEEEGA
jgi:hypothetical protein